MYLINLGPAIERYNLGSGVGGGGEGDFMMSCHVPGYSMPNCALSVLSANLLTILPWNTFW